MVEELSIRVAQSEDVEAIAHLAAKTFHDTFATDSNTSDIAAYIKANCSAEQISAELADDKNTFLLAFTPDSPKPVGYAKTRADEPEACVSGENPIELQRLYVDKSAIGKGIGARLMQACLDKALQNSVETLGHDTIWLGVWENNHQAIRFYERWGFVTVGSHVFTVGEDNQNDWIMQRAVEVD